MPAFATIEMPNLGDLFNFKNNEQKYRQFLDKIKDDALARARQNAPIDTGEFRKSLYVNYILTDKDISFDFGSTMPERVLRLHEEEYRLGPTSKAQPQTKEGGVGNKFFTRVIDFWAETWADQIEEAILNMFEKGDL